MGLPAGGMNFKITIGVLIAVAAISLALSYPTVHPTSTPPGSTSRPSVNTSTVPPTNPLLLYAPISRALERITKKPFGIKISPATSPVQPERFSGYHTGVDFETFPDEANIAVPIYAVCSGSVLLKKYASGYGGVLVQQCNLESEDITVIYGHLKLASISTKVGNRLTAGATIGLLGTGYSTETDGERKHLHLGLHKGTAINIRGYVQSQTELTDWIDFEPYLKQLP